MSNKALGIGVAILIVLAIIVGMSQYIHQRQLEIAPRMHLACADCQATGMKANIWADEKMTRGKCSTVWGVQVAVLENKAGMMKVNVLDGTEPCEGWISSDLVK